MPALALSLDGAALPPELAAAALSVGVTQALNAPAMVVVAFAEPPGGAADALRIGAALAVDAPGGGRLIAADITAVEHLVGQRAGRVLRVRGYDRLHRLRKRQRVRALVARMTLDEKLSFVHWTAGAEGGPLARGVGYLPGVPRLGIPPLQAADGPVGVRLADVRFTYPRADQVSLASLEEVAVLDQRGGEEVLHGIDLEVAPGRLLALVGPSGAGKSTIAALVPRLYDVDGGAVELDGIDVRDLTFAAVRGAVGVVTQDGHLFHDTIAANLRYAAPHATASSASCRARQPRRFGGGGRRSRRSTLPRSTASRRKRSTTSSPSSPGSPSRSATRRASCIRA